MTTDDKLKKPTIARHIAHLEWRIGTPAVEFLDEYCLALLICSRSLLILRTPPLLDYSFMVAPAAKAFEGYLKKLIKDKQLSKKQKYEVGDIFNMDNYRKPTHPVNIQLRDKAYRKIINQIISDWDFCRNKIMHYDEKFRIKDYKQADRKFERILDTIKDSYVAYVGETEPSTDKMLSPSVIQPPSESDKKYSGVFSPRYSPPVSALQRIVESLSKYPRK